MYRRLHRKTIRIFSSRSSSLPSTQQPLPDPYCSSDTAPDDQQRLRPPRHLPARHSAYKRFTGITWHWVIRIPIRLRVFTHDGCTRMLLSGQMFELSNTCIGMIIGVVDRTDRLELVSISQVLMLEA